MAELFQPCNSIVTDYETPAARLLRADVRRESCRIKPALPGVTPAALQMRFQAYLKDCTGHSVHSESFQIPVAQSARAESVSAVPHEDRRFSSLQCGLRSQLGERLRPSDLQVRLCASRERRRVRGTLAPRDLQG